MSTEQIAKPVGQVSSRGTNRAVFWVLTAIFVLGFGSLVYALSNDAVQVDFGLLTVSFLYLMGISQAGVVFCAITRLTRAQWPKPYYRLAGFSTLAFFPFAIVYFLAIFFYGKGDLFYWLSASPDDHLSPWLNSNWLLARNMLGLLVFYGLSSIYVLKGLKFDLSAGRATMADQRQLEQQLYVLSPWILISFIVCNTLFAWDFAMMLIPHWHSTVFPIFFWFGNIFAGCAALILFPLLLGASNAGDSHFGPDQVRYLGMMLTAFTLIWLYLFWAQFFVIWFGNLPPETGPLWRQMYGHYGPYFWTMMTGCFFFPFVAFLFALIKRSLTAMCLIAFSINLGIWISKYLMVVPEFSPDARPFDSWLDVILSMGLLAGFLAVVVLLAGRLPIYAEWEIRLKPEPRR